MEDAGDLQDWELLQVPYPVIHVPAPISSAAPVFLTVEEAAPGAGADACDAFPLDYFGVSAGNRYACPSDGDPHALDGSAPRAGSGFLDGTPREGLGYKASESRDPGSGGHLELGGPSVVQETLPSDHIKEELDDGGSGGSALEMVLEGADSVCSGESEGNLTFSAETGGIVTNEAVTDSFEGGESATDDVESTAALESQVERSNGDSDLQNVAVSEVEKAAVAWWKFPMDVLKFCVFRIKPVWSISIAAALVGFLILGRRLYRKKPNKRSIPLRVSVDDKKVTPLMVRAARLNEAFSSVKQVPVIRSTLPTSAASAWPLLVALR